MGNEPIAWMNKSDDETVFIENTGNTKIIGGSPIPLYTHPAKTEDEPNWKEMYWEMHDLNYKHWSALKAHPEKTLTDEEILALAYEILETWNTKEAMIEFARAILRKAQEK